MDKEEFKFFIKIVMCAIPILLSMIAGIWGLGAGIRVYDVWAQRKAGEAELARAESNRKIKVLESKAHEESAKFLADAEIIRAKGVAEANKIIGESLKNNEGYLRYLWIDGLKDTSNKVIYVPTEGNLPILEAGKR
jgi:regulator of protease activity HflC (stomatin/prohibitin superfamily)